MTSSATITGSASEATNAVEARDATHPAASTAERTNALENPDPVSTLQAFVASAYPYANRAFLSKYIASVDPNNKRADTLRVKIAKRKTMLRIQVLLAFTILVANTVLTFWVMRSYPPDHRGVGTLLVGSCSTINTINSAVHFALNIVSSLFLGAGNYCMQTLVAPSRAEIERAHSKGASLDIGVPNVKNLRHINRKRVIAWVLIGIVASLLHLFWNSAVFASFAYVSYPLATVTSDFSTVSDVWSNPNSNAIDPACRNDAQFNPYQNISSLSVLQIAAKNFTRLENEACIETFFDPRSASRALIVVGLNVTAAQNNGSSLVYGGFSGCFNKWFYSNYWICRGDEQERILTRCTLDQARSSADKWVIAGSYMDGQEIPVTLVDYCLVGEPGDNSQRCGFHYSTYVLPLVCACTLLESLLICWVARKHPEKTMLTIGDALSDFLENPGDATADLGVETPWEPKDRISWFKVITPRAWTISLVLFAITIASATILLGIGIIGMSNDEENPYDHMRFGLDPNLLVSVRMWTSRNEGLDLLEKLFVANSYQLLVSFLYLFYNNILTQQLVAYEWTRFLRPEGKKPLRVSSPVGMQRSSYMLSLPMTYSVPLMISMMLLHSLISQSIFHVQGKAFGPGPETYRIPSYDRSDDGYSLLGIILSTCLGIFLVAALLINAVARHYSNVPADFPAMGTNSLALRAACRPPKGDNEAHLFELRLGIVKDEECGLPRTMGRLTFSTSIKMDSPEPGVIYQQPAMAFKEPSATMAGKLWTLVTKCFGRWSKPLRKRTHPPIKSKSKKG